MVVYCDEVFGLGCSILSCENKFPLKIMNSLIFKSINYIREIIYNKKSQSLREYLFENCVIAFGIVL